VVTVAAGVLARWGDDATTPRPTGRVPGGAATFEILLTVSRTRDGTMDIDVISEEENPMLHRSDVRFEVTHDEATPSRLSVRDSLAAMLNKDADEVVIRQLDTKFGMRKTVGEARIYESPDFAREIEHEYMLDRNKIEPETEAEGEEA
jgi:small subunit ribosomal protein S24e